LAAHRQYRNDDHYVPNGVPGSNTQNRDARALHLKLDELLRSIKQARNNLIDLENCTDEEIDQIERQFHALKEREKRERVNCTHGSQTGRNDKAKA
jgi:low affinity Fe/Cu permease